MRDIERFGWNSGWASLFEPYEAEGRAPARVVCQHRDSYDVFCTAGELRAEIAGRLRHETRFRADLPSVGDWVAISPRVEEGTATIHAVLARKSKFSRKTAGVTQEEQIVAANIDIVLLVNGLDGDFNVRRLERYLTLAWESGARPAIVLNKADLCDCIEERVAQVESVAFGLDVHVVSAVEQQGLEGIRNLLSHGVTAAFLGSSGVGKSSLINALIGRARQAVRGVREDDSRGRHTTSERQMLVLPGGGIVIDTPGMRELQLWSDEESLERAFEDVESLAASCRFADCSHETEPGCTVREAIRTGELDASRYRSYRKLQREIRYIASKQDQRLQMMERDKWKKISREAKKISKERSRMFGK